MPITFQCPNGHRVSCPDDQAGKAGKCPRCGAVIRIPQPGSAVAVAAASQPSAGQGTGEVTAGEGQTSTSGFLELDEAPDEDQGGGGPAGELIVFLCPNGHRLNSPASLAGRPGQCPHCGAKFLIPELEESIEDEQQEHEVAINDDGISLDEIVIQVDPSSRGGPGSSKSRVGNQAAAPPPANPHPLAQLLQRLWPRKAAGATLEIHLGDGKLLAPDEFAARDPRFALFGVREANGSHTLTAVNWDSIERVVVRGLDRLPEEWF